MHMLFGVLQTGPFRYYNPPFLLCRKDRAGLFPSETSEKGKGKHFHCSLSNLATVQVTSYELFHNSDLCILAETA